MSCSHFRRNETDRVVFSLSQEWEHDTVSFAPVKVKTRRGQFYLTVSCFHFHRSETHTHISLVNKPDQQKRFNHFVSIRWNMHADLFLFHTTKRETHIHITLLNKPDQQKRFNLFCVSIRWKMHADLLLFLTTKRAACPRAKESSACARGHTARLAVMVFFFFFLSALWSPTLIATVQLIFFLLSRSKPGAPHKSHHEFFVNEK